MDQWCELPYDTLDPLLIFNMVYQELQSKDICKTKVVYKANVGNSQKVRQNISVSLKPGWFWRQFHEALHQVDVIAIKNVRLDEDVDDL